MGRSILCTCNYAAIRTVLRALRVATSTISIVINSTTRYEPALGAVSVPTVVGGVIGALLVGVLLGSGIVWLCGRGIRYSNRGVDKGSSETDNAEVSTNMELVR
ncbi:hypothetical protein F5B22DRAFT_584690 [Xylaria bambusicola]|uniref:uncharacterized protein n=1 Tax=Xylaria bambusicola TaxID=326684 RepID=UPI002007A4D6|nr:uncharacterized protein F5B22DRAFT_584690 [Xylaria bambusicola]KAI0526173.1 hypothetical protein F5B22DRAFT_584690 [Xylaria bambusicola]